MDLGVWILKVGEDVSFSLLLLLAPALVCSCSFPLHLSAVADELLGRFDMARVVSDSGVFSAGFARLRRPKGPVQGQPAPTLTNQKDHTVDPLVQTILQFSPQRRISETRPIFFGRTHFGQLRYAAHVSVGCSSTVINIRQDYNSESASHTLEIVL